MNEELTGRNWDGYNLMFYGRWQKKCKIETKNKIRKILVENELSVEYNDKNIWVYKKKG